MASWWYPAVVVLVAGCKQLAGLDDPLPGDGGGVPIDAVDASVIDAPENVSCFGTAIVQVCLSSDPSGDRTIPAQTLVTDTSPLCATNVVSGGAGACVIAGATLTIDAGATVRAQGNLALVLVARDTITIAGTLDVASHRVGGRGAGANFSGCANANASPSGGGGAGGSFIGLGGAGGPAGTNPPGNAIGQPTTLHGGCAGHDAGGDPGRRGDGGGAVYLISKDRIDVPGTINASGAGGSNSDVGLDNGGGGGGSGGMIGFDGQTITIGGVVFANGGGGAEGSDATMQGVDGGDPVTAAGGAGGTGASTGGAGGTGAAGATLDGAAGTAGTSGAAGGGGGGGAGVIKVFGSRSGSGTISPAPS